MTPQQVADELLAIGRPQVSLGPDFVALKRNMAVLRAWDLANPEKARRYFELVGMQHEQAELDRQQEEQRALERWANKQLAASGVGARDAEASSEPDDTPAIADARAWWEAPTKPTWLALVGPKGTGKSVASAWLVRTAIWARQTARFVRAAELVRLSSFDEGRAQLESLKRVGLLVVDDFGTEHRTSYGASLVFDVLDTRHANRRRTVVTANGSDKAAIADALGERLLERVETDGWMRRLTGKSLRRVG